MLSKIDSLNSKMEEEKSSTEARVSNLILMMETQSATVNEKFASESMKNDDLIGKIQVANSFM